MGKRYSENLAYHAAVLILAHTFTKARLSMVGLGQAA